MTIARVVELMYLNLETQQRKVICGQLDIARKEPVVPFYQCSDMASLLGGYEVDHHQVGKAIAKRSPKIPTHAVAIYFVDDPYPCIVETVLASVDAYYELCVLYVTT